ncbi:MAG: hypothetical protein RXP91_06460 [Nitrososphaeria archaeon]
MGPGLVVLLAMTVIMMVEHAVVAALSIRGATLRRSIGIPAATYEILYYVLAIATIFPPTALALALYAFAATHFAGGIAYIAAHPRMSGIIGAGRRGLLRYYAAYELAELVFLIALTAFLLSSALRDHPGRVHGDLYRSTHPKMVCGCCGWEVPRSQA